MKRSNKREVESLRKNMALDWILKINKRRLMMGVSTKKT